MAESLVLDPTIETLRRSAMERILVGEYTAALQLLDLAAERLADPLPSDPESPRPRHDVQAALVQRARGLGVWSRALVETRPSVAAEQAGSAHSIMGIASKALGNMIGNGGLSGVDNAASGSGMSLSPASRTIAVEFGRTSLCVGLTAAALHLVGDQELDVPATRTAMDYASLAIGTHGSPGDRNLLAWTTSRINLVDDRLRLGIVGPEGDGYLRVYDLPSSEDRVIAENVTRLSAAPAV